MPSSNAAADPPRPPSSILYLKILTFHSFSEIQFFFCLRLAANNILSFIAISLHISQVLDSINPLF
jgi:hypothetical protein